MFAQLDRADAERRRGAKHEWLGLGSFIPGVGTIAAGYDAYLYHQEGDDFSATLSAVSAIPGGKFFSLLKIGKLLPEATMAAKATKTGSSVLEDAARAESHLARLDSSPANDAMLARIRAAAADGRALHPSESNFLRHELTEADLMDGGMGYDAAHEIAGRTHPTFGNYHPEVIDQFPELFNNNWRNFWGMEPR